MTNNKKSKTDEHYIKCVVWDLDNTIWHGVLLEGNRVSLRKGIVAIIEELDRRGILNTIASKNDYDVAVSKLDDFGIRNYFLYPEINWSPKSTSLQAISRSLNIGLDTFAFVDDQPFEREEVLYNLPEVMCIDADDIYKILEMPEMKPRFITPESKLRRQMYLNDTVRKRAEEAFTGTDEAFLSTLKMIFTIKPAMEEDLQRAEELTIRTHQLNTTGYTFSYNELDRFRLSEEYLLLVASLADKYGIYGTIGLALVELGPKIWVIKLLLMSCRVMSRGVGTIMMNYIMSCAKQKEVSLQAEFMPTGRNRMMYITYKFNGFKEIGKRGDIVLLESDLAQVQAFPNYVQVKIND